jgi:hypothetical protein
MSILSSQFIVPTSKPSPILYIITQSIQCFLNPACRVVQPTSLELHKKDVLERYNLRRPAVYACQIEGIGLEALKHRCESTSGSMINCEGDEGLGLSGLAGGGVGPFPQDEESRCIVLPIFDTSCKNIDVVDLCCKLAGDSCTCAGCVLLYHLCCPACRTNIDPLNTFQVCAKERFTLSECLRMAKNSLDVLETV